MIALGVEDTRARAEEIREFLGVRNARRARPSPG
jgi:hypothetical protein